MGANTVSNHDLAIVTKGTPHNATTQGATDKCLVPPGIPTPFVNYVPSSQLGPGQTEKTYISGQPIVTKRAIISPPSKDPHAGTMGGETSHTYLAEAAMDGASPDVIIEGSPVCRSTDATTQNHANTTGKWIEGDVKAYLAKEVENQKKRCTLVKVEGHCKHGKEGGQRKLGFPPGESAEGKDGYYLEILSDDIITLKATRVNAVPGEKEPNCMYGSLHTKWVIKRTGGGEGPKEETKNGDEQTVDRGMIGMLIDEFMALSTKFKTQGKLTEDQDSMGKGVNPLGQEQQDAAKAAGDKAAAAHPMTPDEQSVRDRTAAGSHIPKARRQGAKAAEKAREADRSAAQKASEKAQGNKNKLSDKKIADAVNISTNLAKLALLWYAKKNPVVIQIEASTCSGAKNVKLVVFPAGKAKFDLFSEKLAQAVQSLKMVANVVKKLGEWFGVRAQVKFLEKPQVNITVEYKELSKDWPPNHLTKWQVNRSFEAQINFDPFLSVKIEVAVPIPTFLAPMGALLARILKYFGAEGVVYISAEVQIVPTAAIRLDEYDIVSGYFKVSIKLELQLGVRIRWGSTAEIWAAGYVETTISFPEWRTTSEHPAQVKVKGEVQFGFKGGAWADVWGWRKSVEFNYRPPNWNVKMGERWLSFMPMP